MVGPIHLESLLTGGTDPPGGSDPPVDRNGGANPPGGSNPLAARCLVIPIHLAGVSRATGIGKKLYRADPSVSTKLI